MRAGELDATKEAPTPVIVAREVDGSRYLNDPSCLEAVNDGTNGLEAKAFYYLANLVKKMTQEEIKKRVDGTLTPEILRRSPAGARGRLVAIEGALMWKQPEDEPPNIAGIDRLYWCILRGEGGERVWVYAVEEPEGIKKRDIVKAYGVFFKTYRYSDRQYRERIALVMMARRLVRVEYKHAPHLAIAGGRSPDAGGRRGRDHRRRHAGGAGHRSDDRAEEGASVRETRSAALGQDPAEGLEPSRTGDRFADPSGQRGGRAGAREGQAARAVRTGGCRIIPRVRRMIRHGGGPLALPPHGGASITSVRVRTCCYACVLRAAWHAICTVRDVRPAVISVLVIRRRILCAE